MEKLYELNMISTFFRLLLALICGGILGIERGKKNRPAGFRTYMLVCVASAMVMITNQYISNMYSTGDPSRMGAQVISGIGFLGAGTIIVTGRNRVKGLTTAAGLWASACMGLAIGIGFYEGAIVGCIFILGGMTILQKLDIYMLSHAKEVEFYIELEKVQEVGEILAYLKDKKVQVAALEITKSRTSGPDRIGMFITLRTEKLWSNLTLIEGFTKLPQVIYIEEV